MNNEIREEIKLKLNILSYGKMLELETISSRYNTYVISEENYIGVCFEITNEKIIEEDYFEKFENMFLRVRKIGIKGELLNVIELLTQRTDNYDAFSMICEDFCNIGNNGENRKEIANNPRIWTKKWKDILGNKKLEEQAYSYLGELLVLLRLSEKNIKANMTENGSHDIETNMKDYEVKTTILRKDAIVEVHSEFQLDNINDKDLSLIFVRLEETLTNANSINNVIEKLHNYYYNVEEMNKIENKVKFLDSEIKNKMYCVLEMREYNIDEYFPRITNKSFKEEKFPNNIKDIHYKVNLEGIKYNNF